MSGLKKVVQNSGIYFFSTIVGKSLLFILGIFLTRYFSTEELGVWNHVFSLVSITVIFSSLNSGVYFISNRFKLEEQKFKEYFSGIQTTLILLSVFASGLVLILHKQLFPIGFEISSKFVFLFIFIICILGLRQLYDSVLQVEKQVKEGVYAQLIHSILTFFLTVIFVMNIDEKWEYRFYAEILAVLCNIIVQIIYLRRFFYKNFFLNLTEFKEIYGFLAPLTFHFLGFLLIMNTDKIMLGKLVGASEVGIYGTAVLFSSILLVLYDSIIKAWQPFYFEKSEQKNEQSQKALFKFTRLYYAGVVALCLGYTAIVYFLFPHLVGENFLEARNYIPLLCFGAMLEGLRKIHANSYYLHKKTKILGVYGFTAGVLNIILNFTLIERMGIMGCVYASILSYLVLYVLTFVRSLSFKVHSG